jgi:hypothetical protein
VSLPKTRNGRCTAKGHTDDTPDGCTRVDTDDHTPAEYECQRSGALGKLDSMFPSQIAFVGVEPFPTKTCRLPERRNTTTRSRNPRSLFKLTLLPALHPKLGVNVPCMVEWWVVGYVMSFKTAREKLCAKFWHFDKHVHQAQQGP